MEQPDMLRLDNLPASAPPILAQIIADFSERNITVTPLAVISRATDLGLSDAEIDRIVDQLAAAAPIGA